VAELGRLVEMTGSGVRTVETAIGQLVVAGLLVPIRGEDGRSTSTRYRLPIAD
jgi:hypothetical protein